MADQGMGSGTADPACHSDRRRDQRHSGVPHRVLVYFWIRIGEGFPTPAEGWLLFLVSLVLIGPGCYHTADPFLEPGKGRDRHGLRFIDDPALGAPGYLSVPAVAAGRFAAKRQVDMPLVKPL